VALQGGRYPAVRRWSPGRRFGHVPVRTLQPYNKSRPILVKLRSVWDKRLILSKRSKLKSYTQRGIFVESDEPVEVRRQQTCERLKYKAERDGENACVIDGVLRINDVAIFSVKDGFLINNLHG
jgi:hypothetical protein